MSMQTIKDKGNDKFQKQKLVFYQFGPLGIAQQVWSIESINAIIIYKAYQFARIKKDVHRVIGAFLKVGSLVNFVSALLLL